MVSVVKEIYTSGTGYPDGEFPEKSSYNISRRIKRGVFKNSKGKLINADVNAASQIIKANGYKDFPIKERELVTGLNAASDISGRGIRLMPLKDRGRSASDI